IRPSNKPTLGPSHDRRSVCSEPVDPGLHTARAVFPAGAVDPRLRWHGAGGGPHPDGQGPGSSAAGTGVGGVGSDLHVLRTRDRDYASLLHPWLDPPFHREGGPVV